MYVLSFISLPKSIALKFDFNKGLKPQFKFWVGTLEGVRAPYKLFKSVDLDRFS